MQWQALNTNIASVNFSVAVKGKGTNYSQHVAVKNDTKSTKINFLLGVCPYWFCSILFWLLAQPVEGCE